MYLGIVLTGDFVGDFDGESVGFLVGEAVRTDTKRIHLVSEMKYENENRRGSTPETIRVVKRTYE